jgi:hypothetical protein
MRLIYMEEVVLLFLQEDVVDVKCMEEENVVLDLLQPLWEEEVVVVKCMEEGVVVKCMEEEKVVFTFLDVE